MLKTLLMRSKNVLSRLVLAAGLFFSMVASTWAQELNCVVIINADNAPNVDQRVKDDMQTSFTQFLNENNWTEDRFEPQERINCIINLTIESVSNQTFYKGTAQIQASRPVYGTNYETLVLRYFDQSWDFEYNPGQPLNYSDNAFTNDITALLSYYAFVILGFDYDSFSPLGGSEFFQKAWNVVNLAQGVSRGAWDQFVNNGRNRYEFANQMANGQMNDLRTAWYDYHIKGLDQFLNKEEESRQIIFDAIDTWQRLNKERPNTLVNSVVMDTKAEELVKVFSRGQQNLRQQAFNLLRELDPTRTDRYQEILAN